LLSRYARRRFFWSPTPLNAFVSYRVHGGALFVRAIHSMQLRHSRLWDELLARSAIGGGRDESINN
jgi:hypothetical protein